MSSKLLYYHELNSQLFVRQSMEHLVEYYGLDLARIDLLKAYERAENPLAFDILCDARTALADHNWVFLHQEGDVILDEFAHPEGATVYALGSNDTGFGCPVGDLPEDAVTVRLRNSVVLSDYATAHILLYDRYLFQNGRRVV